MGQREEGGGREEENERYAWREGKASLLLLPLEEDLPLPLKEYTIVIAVVVVCRWRNSVIMRNTVG